MIVYIFFVCHEKKLAAWDSPTFCLKFPLAMKSKSGTHQPAARLLVGMERARAGNSQGWLPSRERATARRGGGGSSVPLRAAGSLNLTDYLKVE